MDKLKIGHLITEPQERDAIHIAVVPVQMHDVEGAYAGDLVGLVKQIQDQVTRSTSNPIGIIDPFLRGKVRQGDKCWLFLFPGSITSLRHGWTHPAFDSVEESPRVKAEKYIDAFAERHLWHKKQLLEACEIYASGSCCDSQIADKLMNTSQAEWELFWPQWEIFTGQKAIEKPSEYFSCAC